MWILELEKLNVSLGLGVRARAEIWNE